MLLLPEGKTGESWVPRGYGTEEYFHIVATPYMCVLDKEALGEVFLVVVFLGLPPLVTFLH